MVTGKYNGIKYAFLHIPKTGGRMISELLTKHFNGTMPHRNLHAVPTEYDKDVRVFTVLRNPIMLYRSWWGHTMNKAKAGVVLSTEFNEIEREVRVDANAFINRMAKNSPGYLGKLYERYIAKCTHVGVSESIPSILDKVLEIGGKDEIETELTGSPIPPLCNVTGDNGWDVSAESVALLMRSEIVAFDMWIAAACGQQRGRFQ